MASSITRDSSEFFKFVYSSEGPREDWSDCYNEKGEVTHKSKILEAGRVYVPHNTESLNTFLTGRGLPQARKIEQEEHEGFLKQYLVLTLSVEEWNKQILPIREQFTLRLAEFVESQRKVASSIKRDPSEYFEFVYSSKGPREDWRDCYNEKGEVTHKSKILEAGSAYVLENRENLNTFLTGQGLPQARKIEQEEHEGFLKQYLVLTLSVEEWNAQILPVRQQFTLRLAEFVKSQRKVELKA